MDKKKIIALVAAALGCSLYASGQQAISPLTHLHHARQAMQVETYAGVAEALAPIYRDTWSLPLLEEEALYLDAIARSCMDSEEADLKLLRFIEQHPHSALLPYAQSRLGEWYYVRSDYSSAVYWLERVDITVLPEERAEAIDYYHAYSLMKTGADEEALKIFLPLTYSEDFHNPAAFYGGYLLLKVDRKAEGERLLSQLYNDGTFEAEAMAYVAESRLTSEDYEGALKLAQRGLRRSRTGSSAHLSLLHTAGLAADMLGEPSLATDYLRQYMKGATMPGRIDLLVLGKSLYALGEESEAASYLSRVDDGTPDFMSQLSHYYLGLTALGEGQSEEALWSFDRAAEIDVYGPLTEDATFNAALAAYAPRQGRLGDGTKRLARYLSRYPSGAYRDKVINYLSDAFLNDPDRSAVMEEIAVISPLPPKLNRVREKVRLGQANQALAGGDISSATEQYDRIIRQDQDPESVAEAYLWRGEAAYRRGDYRSAIRDTRAYLDHRPASLPLNAQAYYTLGYAYFNTKEYSRAKEVFRTFLSAKSDASATERTAVLNRLGDIAVRERLLDDAGEYFAQADGIGGQEADYGYLHRAIVLGLQKDYEGKVALLSRMQERYPASSLLPEGFFELGQTYSILGRQREARSAYDRVVSGFPRHQLAPAAGVQKALTYMSEEDYDRAAETYAFVIRTYPTTDAAKTAIENLKGLSIQLNRVEDFNRLIKSVGSSAAISDDDMEEMTYLAADKVVAEGNPSEALAALDDYLARYPQGKHLDRALFSKALLLSSAKRYDESVPVLERLSRLLSEGPLLRDVRTLLLEGYEATGASAKAAEVSLTLARGSSAREERSRYVTLAADYAIAGRDYSLLYSLADEVSRSRWDVTTVTQAHVMSAAAEVYDQLERTDMARLYAQAVLRLPAAVQTTSARVIAADELFDQGQYSAVRERMEAVVSGKTDSPYWLARAFILLADSYDRLGDPDTARTYLESLRSNYSRRDDGIIAMIDKRLATL